jgi:tetratricopeptide (TPR) repeat protein
MSFDPRAIQHQIRQNADSVRQFMEEIVEWESVISERDRKLEEGKLQLTKATDGMAVRSSQSAVQTHALDPEDMRIFLEQKAKGNNFFNAGEYSKALDCYTVCVDRCPQNPFGFSNRASALFQLDRVVEAEEDICCAIELDKQNISALLKRANMRKKLSRLDDALEDLNRVLGLDPTNGPAKKLLPTLKALKQQEQQKKNQSVKATPAPPRTSGLLEGFCPEAVDFSPDVPIIARRRVKVRIVDEDSESDPDAPAESRIVFNRPVHPDT